MEPQPFEQYQLSCIEERPMGAALISICQTLYRLDFYNRDECRDFYEDASLWDVFLFCPLTPGTWCGGVLRKPHSLFGCGFFMEKSALTKHSKEALLPERIFK